MARAVVRSRNSRIGMIGSATLSSVSDRAPRAGQPAPTIQAVCVDHQAKSLPARETQTSSTETPPMIRAAPR